MQAINEWLEEIDCEGQLEAMSAKESVVMYYRLKSSMHSGVVLDFSQKEEAFKPFLKLNLPLYEAGVTVPKIFTYNREEFFVFMEDLGSTHLCDVNSSDVELFYDKAIDSIVKIQNTETEELALYDEVALKQDIKLKESEHAIDFIISKLLSQPQNVFVHGDYQAKNLMFNCNDSIVVTEYYNAKIGAVTYDLASLLCDGNLAFSSKKIEGLALNFKDKKGLDADDKTFLEWFHFSMMHRCLSIMETEKINMNYLIEIASLYEETSPLVKLLKSMD